MSDCINRGCGGKKDGVCMNDFPGVKCYGYEPPRKTNADRIRQMSDEELADEYIRIYHKLGWYTDSWAWLRKWLKSPVEETKK